jgi:hypothetical protein
MMRNVWYKLVLIVLEHKLVMVIVNGNPVISLPDSNPKEGLENVQEAFESIMMDSKLADKNWPFGALYLGNSGLKQSQLESKDRSWLNEMFYGAISSLEISKHGKGEMSALFELYPSSASENALDAKGGTLKSVERVSALGTLENVLGGRTKPNFAFPPNSFPMPSRIGRPLYSVSEMDQWEDYICAFSKLKLPPMQPIPLQPRRPHPGPIVLLCHDFRGGYFKDSAWERSPISGDADSSNLMQKEKFQISKTGNDGRAQISITSFVPDVYTFTHWSYIDIFTYFSHSRVSIPPAATIQAAHMNGVEVLGTLICEWETGYLDTKRLIAGKEGDKAYYSKRLIEIASRCCFEGWLVNIEHSMNKEEVIELAAWLKQFKSLANEVGQKIVWYDSVINTGELKWQSCVNEKNSIFFDSCDYFFTDYHWKLSNLETSYLSCKGEFNKVMVGIDVWGRGCYGGGGWNTPVALKAIFKTGRTESSSDSGTSDSDDPLLVKHRHEHHQLHRNQSLTKPDPTKLSSSFSSLSPSLLLDGDEESKKFSVALFAPGWTIESQADSFDSLYRNEMRFWQGKDYWNIFSKQFEPKLEVYFRLYQTQKKVVEEHPDHHSDYDFSVQDILSLFEYSEDGTAWAAERQAAAYSQKSPNETVGRFPGLPQLFEPRTAGSQWSWRHIRFDCADTVLTGEYMDQQPELNLSVWFKGNGPNPQDPFRLRVLLLDSKNQLVSDFDSGVLKGEAEWRQLSFVWRGYGAGVRRILWLDGSRDAENWAGFYGCTIDRPSIYIANPHAGESVSSFVSQRLLQNAALPFVSTFDLGQGSAVYSNGSPIQYSLPSGEMWYNLAAQSQMPTLNVSFEAIAQLSMPLSPNSSPASPSSSSYSSYSSSASSLSGPSNPSPTSPHPSRSTSPPHSLGVSERVPLSPTHAKIITHVNARIMDASNIDGGVWQGSSCLKVEASIVPSEHHHHHHHQQHHHVPSKSAPKLTSLSGAEPAKSSNETSMTSSPVSPSVPKVSSLVRRRSSLKLLFEASKLQSPAEQASISLYPLCIDSPGQSVILKFVCRPIYIPSNSMVRVLISRERKNVESTSPSVGNTSETVGIASTSTAGNAGASVGTSNATLEPLSWDLLGNEHRDPNAPSSLGWIHFTATWTCEPHTVYTGVSLAILAVHMSADLLSASPRSPRSPRLAHIPIHPSSSQPLPSTLRNDTIPSPSHLELLIGFLHLEADSAASVPNPPLSAPLSARRESNSALGLDYKLTWSSKSIFAEAAHFDLTAYWRCPEVPAHLTHLGPPHFIVTATLAHKKDPEGPTEIKVIAQGKTWTPSWVISSLPAAGELTFTVNTVYPDYSNPSHLTDRIQIQWPSESLSF